MAQYRKNNFTNLQSSIISLGLASVFAILAYLSRDHDNSAVYIASVILGALMGLLGVFYGVKLAIANDRSGRFLGILKVLGSRTSIVAMATLLIVGLVGYWFEYRPYAATKHCKNVALEETGYKEEYWLAWSSEYKVQSRYAFIYDICMQKEGIK